MRAAFKSVSLSFLVSLAIITANAQVVTYKPYIELGDAGPFGPLDQIVIAWQTNESSPDPSAYSVEYGETVAYDPSVTPGARVVDNYLAADPRRR